MHALCVSIRGPLLHWQQYNGQFRSHTLILTSCHVYSWNVAVVSFFFVAYFATLWWIKMNIYRQYCVKLTYTSKPPVPRFMGACRIKPSGWEFKLFHALSARKWAPPPVNCFRRLHWPVFWVEILWTMNYSNLFDNYFVLQFSWHWHHFDAAGLISVWL